MNLNMLILEGNKEHEKLNAVTPINFQSYHVAEIFMYHLVKIDLDGSSKLVIYFKEKPKSEPKYVCDKNFHVSWYYVDKSDMDNLLTLNKEELDGYYLDVIANAFKYIAQHNNCNQKIFTMIEEIVQKVKNSGYRLTQKIKKLSKLSQNKQFKATVYRQIDNEGEMWYVEIEDKNKNIYNYDIVKKTSHISKMKFYVKSQWEGDKFILLNKLNQVVATIRVN